MLLALQTVAEFESLSVHCTIDRTAPIQNPLRNNTLFCEFRNSLNHKRLPSRVPFGLIYNERDLLRTGLFLVTENASKLLTGLSVFRGYRTFDSGVNKLCELRPRLAWHRCHKSVTL